jgi:hypothetical protein
LIHFKPLTLHAEAYASVRGNALFTAANVAPRDLQPARGEMHVDVDVHACDVVVVSGAAAGIGVAVAGAQ